MKTLTIVLLCMASCVSTTRQPNPNSWRRLTRARPSEQRFYLQTKPNSVTTLCDVGELEENEPLRPITCKQFMKLSTASDKTLERIHSNTFDLFPNVSSITMNDLGISEIDVGAFKSLRNLELLNLNGNRIQSLPDKLFKNNQNLQIVTIRNSNLQTINEQLFDNLYNLQTLEMSANQLQELPGEWYKGLISLRALRLDHNRLTTLRSGMFQGMSKLTDLALNNNDIKKIETGAFKGLTSLQALWLDSNGKIESEDVLSELKTLRKLSTLSLSPSSVNCEVWELIQGWTVENKIYLRNSKEGDTCWNS